MSKLLQQTSDSKLEGLMDCRHLSVDELGNCKDCGQTIEEYLAELSNINYLEFPSVELPLVDLGDLKGILKLADSTIKTFECKLIELYDPNSSGQPKIRRIGNLIFRQTWNEIWNEIVAKSYPEAVRLGYRQSLSKWNEFLEDTVKVNLFLQKK